MLNNNSNAFVFATTILLGGIALSACKAKPAQAPEAKLHPLDARHAIRKFPKTDMKFTQNQLFFWKKDTTEEQATTVIEAGGKAEALQDALYKMQLSNRDLVSKFTGLTAADGTDLDVTQLQTDEATLPEKQAQLDNLTAQRDAALRQPTVDNSKVTSLNNKIKAQNKKIDKIKANLGVIHSKNLDNEYSSLKDLSQQIAQSQSTLNEALMILDQSLWIFNTPTIAFNFSFGKDQAINANISNWDLSQINDPEIAETGSPTDFSTDASTVRNVTYSELGGALSFEVYTPHAAYWFKVAHNKYDAIDGFTHFKGDIIRCGVEGAGQPAIIHDQDVIKCGLDSNSANPPGKAVLRRGVANLTST